MEINYDVRNGIETPFNTEKFYVYRKGEMFQEVDTYDEGLEVISRCKPREKRLGE